MLHNLKSVLEKSIVTKESYTRTRTGNIDKLNH